MGICSSCLYHRKEKVSFVESVFNNRAPLAQSESMDDMYIMNMNSDDHFMEVGESTTTTPNSDSAAEHLYVPGKARKFNEVKVRTIKFYLPEEYDTNEINYIGGGSYGDVVWTKLQRGGKTYEVAVKKMRHAFADAFQARRIYREIKLLQLMRHPNIIEAIDLYTPDPDEENFKDVYLVTEYAGNSLQTCLSHQKYIGKVLLTPDHVQLIVYQLLLALKYIHSANIIHRDLKPGNLAITENCDLKVLDFGLARSLGRTAPDLTQYVMTRCYRSPEVIYWNIGNYNTQADIWSVGCIAAELMSGNILFNGETATAQYEIITRLVGSPDIDLLEKIEQRNSRDMRTVIESYEQHQRVDFYEYFKPYDKYFIDFLDKILVLDPEKRITVQQALKHPYMASFHNPEDETTADWVLQDDEKKNVTEWKKHVWREIQSFNPRVPQEH